MNAPTRPQKPLIAREAADYLGISLTMLYRHLKDGAIRASQPNGKKWYFRLEDLDAWIESGFSKQCGNHGACASGVCTNGPSGDCACSNDGNNVGNEATDCLGSGSCPSGGAIKSEVQQAAISMGQGCAGNAVTSTPALTKTSANEARIEGRR